MVSTMKILHFLLVQKVRKKDLRKGLSNEISFPLPETENVSDLYASYELPPFLAVPVAFQAYFITEAPFIPSVLFLHRLAAFTDFRERIEFSSRLRLYKGSARSTLVRVQVLTGGNRLPGFKVTFVQ